MAHVGDVGTEIAPEVADDPDLAARLDDLLHRTCHLARALTGAEQSALKIDLDGDGHATRKFFNLSERYERWRDYRADPRGLGLHGLELTPGEVVRGAAFPLISAARSPGASPTPPAPRP